MNDFDYIIIPLRIDLFRIGSRTSNFYSINRSILNAIRVQTGPHYDVDFTLAGQACTPRLNSHEFYQKLLKIGAEQGIYLHKVSGTQLEAFLKEHLDASGSVKESISSTLALHLSSSKNKGRGCKVVFQDVVYWHGPEDIEKKGPKSMYIQFRVLK